MVVILLNLCGVCVCVCAVVLPGMNVVRASLIMFTAHSLHRIFVSYTLLRLYST